MRHKAGMMLARIHWQTLVGLVTVVIIVRQLLRLVLAHAQAQPQVLHRVVVAAKDGVMQRKVGLINLMTLGQDRFC